MTNLTIAMVNEMDRKGLQATAKQMGIKANQKSAVLVNEISMVLYDLEIKAEAEESTIEIVEYTAADGEEEMKAAISTHPTTPEDKLDEEYDEFFNDDKEVEPVASEASVAVDTKEEDEEVVDTHAIDIDNSYLVGASVPVDNDEELFEEAVVVKPVKVFEYVRSNNLGVVFKQKGVEVKIGWNPNDAKPYIKVGSAPMKIMSIQTAIDSFKPFKNHLHGDVAQIVKALVRVKKMPAQVLAAQKERARAKRAVVESTSTKPVETKKTSTQRYTGTIDAGWLSAFRLQFEINEDRLPSGYEIRNAWMERQAQ